MFKYKLIIFDLDDTLFDYQATEIDSILNTCNDLGLPFVKSDTYLLYKKANNLAKDSIANLKSREDFNSFRLLRAKLFLDNFKGNKIDVKSFINLQLKYSENGILIPNVYETLKTLSGNINIVIGTNGSTYPRLNKIRNSKISHFVSNFFSSEDMGVQKPDAGFFLTILKNFKEINISDVLVVGNDFNTDIMGALNANLDCCYFRFKEKQNPNRYDNIKTIEDFSEILNIIKS